MPGTNEITLLERVGHEKRQTQTPFYVEMHVRFSAFKASPAAGRRLSSLPFELWRGLWCLAGIVEVWMGGRSDAAVAAVAPASTTTRTATTAAAAMYERPDRAEICYARAPWGLAAPTLPGNAKSKQIADPALF